MCPKATLVINPLSFKVVSNSGVKYLGVSQGTNFKSIQMIGTLNILATSLGVFI